MNLDEYRQVHVLLSTYNGASYLREQLDSILQQEGVSVILHVRDDGSTDSTIEILSEYKVKFPERIFFLDDKPGNLGVIRSFEVLLKSVDADYYAFADQDDVWMSNKLRDSLDLLQREEGTKKLPTLIYSDLMVVDESLQQINPSFYDFSSLSPHRGESLKQLLVQNSVVGCTCVFNDSLKKVSFPFPDSIRMHDWWMALCANAYGKSLFMDQKTMYYRQHSHNVIGATSFLQVLTGKKKRKGTTFDSIAQGSALLNHGRELKAQDQDLLSKLLQASILAKKWVCFKNGIKKDGLLRNLYFFLIEK